MEEKLEIELKDERYILKESEFSRYFKSNFSRFGFKKILTKEGRAGYDLLMEDNNGKKVRVELEIKSSNFCLHKHNPEEVDLVVCLYKDKELPVPQIAISDKIPKCVYLCGDVYELIKDYIKNFGILEKERKGIIVINKMINYAVEYFLSRINMGDNDLEEAFWKSISPSIILLKERNSFINPILKVEQGYYACKLITSGEITEPVILNNLLIKILEGQRLVQSNIEYARIIR